jgi:S1-C subfamily serine protease
MRNLFLAIFLMILSSSLSVAGNVDPNLVQHLQAISVTVETEVGSGSGVLRTVVRDKEKTTLCLTAAHVIENLRSTKKVIDSKTGTERVVVEFEDAKIVKVLVADGRTVGKVEMFAEVIKYNQDEDLAVLKVRQKEFSSESVEFAKTDAQVGVGLIHVGSFLGEKLGSNSLSTGIVSQLGRLIEHKTFTQTTVTAFPGSSGGGVYNEQGLLVGMILRGSGEQMNYMCPVSRLSKWAKTANIMWVIDNSVKMPSDEELTKLPVEDNGVTFGDNYKAAIVGGHHSKLIYTNQKKFSEKLDELFSPND